MIASKRCPRCTSILPVSDFHGDRRSKDGLKSYCKKCALVVLGEVRERKRAMKSRDDVYSSDYQKKCNKCREELPACDFQYNPLRADWLAASCFRCMDEYEKSRRMDPEKRRRLKSNSLRCRFGIDMDFYEEMLEFQGGACAICGGDDQVKTASLGVDHDHATGEVRGLLCRSCNSAIGQLGDDYGRIIRAAEYIAEPTTKAMSRKGARVA